MLPVRICGLLGIVALIALPVTGSAQVPDSLPEGVTAQMIETGAALYGGAGLCAVCHGANGEGSIGPDLADDEWVHSDGSYDAIVHQILEGVPADKSESGVPMPPKGGATLTDEQVRAVAAYVWSLRFKES
ncbi:MAG: cytochrome c [Gemmatimonadetes bacterium]|nr:cytochrome c [Gemmatimonadota bacterium]